MKNLVKHVQNVNFQSNLWGSGDTIIIGVSGGPDSMCLLDVMTKIAQKVDLTLIVAHVNYGLRGEDSLKDQKLVEETTKNYGITCELHTCTDFLGNNENDWRNIRYDFFRKLQKKHNATNIAIAHNQNDQAETLLLHLFRGAGLNGLSAMQIKTNNIIRPLLTTNKESVLTYCSQNNIQYNIDKTNLDSTFTRNKIRNELIPYLEKNINSQITTILSESSKTIAADYDFLQNSIEKFWNINDKKTKIDFGAKAFIKLHSSVQRNSLRLIIKELNNNIQNIDSNLIEEYIKSISSTKNKHQKISTKDLKMLKKGDTVEFMKIEI